MSSQSSLGDCRLYCRHNAISSYEIVVSLIGWLPTLELYFPSSMKDIGQMCCVAELLVEAACIKGAELDWTNSHRNGRWPYAISVV